MEMKSLRMKTTTPTKAGSANPKGESHPRRYLPTPFSSLHLIILKTARSLMSRWISAARYRDIVINLSINVIRLVSSSAKAIREPARAGWLKKSRASDNDAESIRRVRWPRYAE